MEAARQAIPLRSLADASERRLEGLLARWRPIGGAQGIGQVMRADEHRIEAGYGINLVGDLHSLDVLGLDHDQDFLVSAFVILLGRGTEVQGMHTSADGSISPRRVLGRG